MLDYESRFRDEVIDRFVDSYIAGETPVPCIECNRQIKFRDLLDTARDLGAAGAGHRALRRPAGRCRTAAAALYRAADAERDQSYFLYATTPEQLAMLRFPLGDVAKARTRELARELGLSVAEKSDSQDICFVPTGRYTDIIEKLKPQAAEPGEIVHLDGRVLGAPSRRDALHRGPAHAGSASPPASRSTWCASRPRTRAWSWARARRWRRSSVRAARRELAGRRAAGGAAAEGLEIAVARALHPRAAAGAAAPRGRGGWRWSSLAGEYGVSPGQACVFYDSVGRRAPACWAAASIRSAAPAALPSRRRPAAAPSAAVAGLRHGSGAEQPRQQAPSRPPTRAGRRSTTSPSPP